ncbi:cell division ATP-binding protein FtsE [Helicobacter sp. 23-1045]
MISAKNLHLGYGKDLIIKNATFEVKKEDFVFITGVSGSGKSTLLRSMYGNLPVRSGALSVCGFNLHNAKKRDIASLRRKIGIIFQDYKLIKEWSVAKNIMLSMEIANHPPTRAKRIEQMEHLLAHVKLEHKIKKYPLELSGGEQQRVALARAMATTPKIIFADEPTGNLDDYSSNIIWRLLEGANEQLHATIVVVTHRMPDEINAQKFRRLHIENGAVYENI